MGFVFEERYEGSCDVCGSTRADGASFSLYNSTCFDCEHKAYRSRPEYEEESRERYERVMREDFPSDFYDEDY